jgi:NodT family efflux transporter outer membrane factor (OMF) lipoprotein
MITKTKISFLTIASVLFISSCKIKDKTWQASDAVVPATFAGRTDTTSAAAMSYDKFFTDRQLVALLDTALQNNADVRIAYERVEAAGAGLLSARGALLPSFNVQMTGGSTRFGNYTMDGMGNATTPGVPFPIINDYFPGVSSSWEADVWGKLKNKKRAARMRYFATKAGADLVKTRLISEVAYRYYNLCALDEELSILDTNIRLQTRALEIVKLQKEAGRATELAVKQCEAQLARTRGMEYRVKTDILTAENELNFLLGRYSVPVKRSGIKLEQADKITGIGVPAQLLQRRPDVVQAEMELAASNADVAAARAAFFPALTISATAGFNAYHTSVLFDPVSAAYAAMGGLVAPVFNKNLIKAGYNAAKAGNREAFAQYGKTVMNAVYEVSTNVGRIANLKAQYAQNVISATALDEAVAISGDLFIGGYANYLEIITAQRNAIEADLEVVQSKKNIMIGVVDLYRALGGR